MGRTLVTSGTRFEALAGYSRAVVDGDMVYLSGTVGIDYATQRMPEGAVAQTEQIVRNIQTTLEAVGSSLADVLRVRVFLADRADLLPVCEVIGRHFRTVRAANTTVCTTLATAEMRVEIEATARRGSGRGRPRVIALGGGTPAARARSRGLARATTTSRRRG
jgi:enamine deaminase RidA (YjgF/YER057c/UK114 family)